MNLLKNMEAIFIVAVALTFSAAALAKEPVAAKKPTVASTKMHKVVIVAKRPSKAEKAQLAAL